MGRADRLLRPWRRPRQIDDLRKEKTMKLVRFATSDTGSKPGIMVDDRIIALNELFPEAPTDMIGVIECWEEIKGPVAKRIKERAASPVRNPTLLAPIARPGKILAIGLNYADHIEEAKAAGVKIPTEQVWFCKQPTSVNSPFGAIHKPIVSDQLDYEVELVVTSARRGVGFRHSELRTMCLAIRSAMTFPFAIGSRKPHNGCSESLSTRIVLLDRA
jgi:Fumarylacetoacetate (FAA) hydrolase family